MDKSQADAIARAIFTPDLGAQETRHRKRAKEIWWRAEKRKAGWLMLAGFALGGVVAQLAGERFITGGLWGSMSGGAMGWLWVGWRNFRHAA